MGLHVARVLVEGNLLTINSMIIDGAAHRPRATCERRWPSNGGGRMLSKSSLPSSATGTMWSNSHPYSESRLP